MWPVADTMTVDEFRQQLLAHGERIALDDGQRRWRYDEMLAEVGRRQRVLQQAGVQRLSIALDNGVDWLLWDLAALFAGVICVPLPGFFSPAQQAHVLDSAGVDAVVTRWPQAVASLGFAESGHGLLQRNIEAAPPVPAGTLKITYTSGTTGQPKGVCLGADSMLAVAGSLSAAFGASAIERHLCVLPLAVLLDNLAGNYAPLLHGACVCLPALAEVGLQGASQFEVAALLQSLQRFRPDSLILLPQLLLALVTAVEQGAPLPAALRFIAVGGGRVAPQLLQRAAAFGLPVFEGYGLSECASVVCLNQPAAQRIGTVGKPLPHLDVSLAEDGEVLVRGPHYLGYLGEPPLQDDWLATGDLGHWDDGFLVLHGRKKHQFITAFGRNVNPEWVEAELVQQPAIAQAWLYGEALPANVALIVPRSAQVTAGQLQAAIDAVNAGLPDYARVHHWLPAAEPFSTANGLATSNGRLKRAALLEHYRQAIAALAQETA